jgi:hypothetical protein
LPDFSIVEDLNWPLPKNAEASLTEASTAFPFDSVKKVGLPASRVASVFLFRILTIFDFGNSLMYFSGMADEAGQSLKY